MDLTVMERIQLLSLLPREGSFVTLLVIRDLRTALGFSEAEIKTLNLHEDKGMILWDSAQAMLKEVAVGEVALEIIRKALKQLSESVPPKLTLDMLPLYERFVEKTPQSI